MPRKTKIFETIADIAYISGYHKYSSGDSRLDATLFFEWAIEFEKNHKRTDWEQADYILLVEEFTVNKIKAEQESVVACC
jgi:hypothetical protein